MGLKGSCLKSLGLLSPGLEISWLKSPGLKGLGLKLGVEKSGVEMSFNPTGERCEENFNDCLSNPCIKGKCIDGINMYTCQCEPGYSGSNCQIACPTGDSKYKMIEDTCYYFEKTEMSYDAAENNCALKLPGSIIAEPKTVKVNDLLYKESESLFGSTEELWIGIGYSDSKSNFIYKSNNQIINFENWVSTSSSQRKKSETIYCGTWYYVGWYHNTNCASSMESICQST